MSLCPNVMQQCYNPHLTRPKIYQDPEEQTEDDNDLYEGNEDLRLCRLGVGKLHSHDLNQQEEKFHPAVNPSDKVEDCSLLIEKQLKNCMAGTKEPQLVEDEEKI